MTDTTHEAPERIWSTGNSLLGLWNAWPIEGATEVEYVRADRIEELEAENHLFKTAGVIEVAARNNRVTEYMFHWEGRALDAEAKLAQQDDLVQAAVAAALREAAQLMVIHRAFAVEEHGERSLIVADMDSRRHSILALITPDAQAALDRALLAEVRAVKDSLTAAYIELAAERERFSQTPEVRALIYAAKAVMHDLHHGNGLEGLYKNRDRLEVALSAFEGDA